MTASAWARALRALIEREAPQATLERTRGGHLRIVFPNGRTVTCAGTPSDWRSLLNTRAIVRRVARQSREG